MKKSFNYTTKLKLETGAHTSRIHQLLVTPDEKTLITSGGDKTIRLWNTTTKEQAGMLLGQIGDGTDGAIQAIAISRDGRYVVALVWMYPGESQDAQDRETDVRVYELATGNLQAGFRYPGTLQDLDFSLDGKYLALVGNPNASVRRGYVMIHETKKMIRGVGKLPSPITSDILYENDLIPSYVRFVPEKRGKGNSYRLVAASWEHWRPGAPEYSGRLFWFTFSALNKLKKMIDMELDEQIAPDSLTVSGQFAVVTAAALSEDKNKKFFCYDHNGKLLNAVDSETLPATPVFSRDENQLIVGQREDSAIIQIKVYDTAFGQFPLKSAYFGHDSEALGTALLSKGMAVSAGGDQNAIHFWSTSHMEGEQVAEINGAGRVLHVVGISPDEQIGFGTRDNLRLKDGNIVLQRAFDLRSMTLKSFPFQDAAEFQRAQKTFGAQSLDFTDQISGYWNLWLLPDQGLFPLPSGSWYNVSTYGFTEKGSAIIGSPDGKLRVAPRSPEGYYQLTERLLVGHEASVLDHASSGRWLVTAGADQILRLWYLEDAEQDTAENLHPALNLFVGADDEWVIWSKSGYYNASERGDLRFGYHVNRGSEMEAVYFASDRLSKTFFRPDIIQAIVEQGSEERALAKLAEQGVPTPEVVVANILPPIVELLPKGIAVTKSDVTFRFAVEELTRENPVTRVWIVQNERFAWEAHTITAKYKATLRLQSGRNTFKILAETKNAKSTPLRFEVMGPQIVVKRKEKTISQVPLDGLGTARGGEAEAARFQSNTLIQDQANGTLYVLAVGVSKLKNETDDFKSLNYADDDAGSIYNAFARSVLTDTSKYQGSLKNKAFKSVEATILLNEKATKEAILKEVDSISEKIKKRDTKNASDRDVLLVFLSGHGVRRRDKSDGDDKPVSQELYFWCYDLDFNQTRATGLSFIELGEKITSLPADVILATDACHSGMAGSDVVRGLDPNELAKRIYAINERGMYILNASRSEEFAREHEKIGHGVFTKAILETLEFETDMSMLNFMASVQRRVLYYTNRLQTPVFRLYGDLLPLIIYEK